MNMLFRGLLVVCAVLGFGFKSIAASGWPNNYQGVMLQGFYWDSYDDTNWVNLESRSDELSKYFKLIWVPNSGKCSYMGYMPQYWFSNHNSAFGTESQLRKMIATYKAKGTGIIEDVVINHRNGVTNWYDFPVEKWNGRTWQIGLDGICSNDEMVFASGQPKPTGNPDTGENFDGCRDLDHTNANVQDNCKNYCKFLLEDLGYAGFRLDMVKGYGGQYTKIYNQYSNPTYCVGEYWDGNYDAVAGWIEATGKTSAAFDFPCKYAINEAFHSGDMTKLVWKANGVTDQPAGLIHYGYSRYAVTFIDNHDTYRDGSKFNGNVVAANAFILCSPGTPCVFLPHYDANKVAIRRLIEIRNGVGLHNNSPVKVLRSDRSCYMAEVTGTRGKLVVKIGSAMVSPDGYTDADIKATGNGYCVWTRVDIGNGNNENDPTKSVTIYYDNSSSKWTTPHIHYWGDGGESKWPGEAMSKHKDNIWVYTCPAGTTGCLFNAGDGDATKTTDFEALDGHLYSRSGDRGVYNEDENGGSTAPDKLYLLGNLSVGSWTTDKGVEMVKTSDPNILTANAVDFVAAGDNEVCYFNIASQLGADWDAINSADRFGADSEGVAVTLDIPMPVETYRVGINASDCKSWTVAPGTYNVKFDWENMTLTLSSDTGIDGIVTDDAKGNPEYFNLQGIKVVNPTAGNLYIVRCGTTVTKEYFR